MVQDSQIAFFEFSETKGTVSPFGAQIMDDETAWVHELCRDRGRRFVAPLETQDTGYSFWFWAGRGRIPMALWGPKAPPATIVPQA